MRTLSRLQALFCDKLDIPRELMIAVMQEDLVRRHRLTLVKSRSDDYTKSHPSAADVLLAVEVSQSSLRFDRERKLPLYARSAIPEYWIVDVVKPVLYVFHTLENGRYLHESSISRPGLLALSALAESEVDLTGLFEGL